MKRRLAGQGLSDRGDSALGIGGRLLRLDWVFVLLVVIAASVGFGMLYSAAGGSIDPWASRQMIRFAAGLVIMFAIALTDIRFWLKQAYVLFGGCLLLLIAVEVAGFVGMGAQRWLSIGPISIQPSELMKVGLVLALARYFHDLEEGGGSDGIINLLPPLAMVAAPVLLVLRQPDLGTALMLVAGSGVIFFLAGVALWKFGIVLAAIGAAAPIAWQLLHDYQRQRVLTFMEPERDPLGSGYHILQSKIALGSGGIFGKGFLGGTQAHLSFLPEKQTDFIFTMLAEEFGLAGCVFLLGIYTAIVAYCFLIAFRASNRFGRLVAIGIGMTFFLYAFINMAMVMGVLPVVGVPLPLVSYGGTAMLTLQVGFGFLLSVSIWRGARDEGNHRRASRRVSV